MPVNSASAVSARMFKIAEATGKAQLAAVKAATAVVDRGVHAASPAGLRNASKSGGKLSTQVRLTRGDNPTGSVKAIGPWPLIEFDTPEHLIGIGRATTGRGATFKGKRRAKVTVSNGAALGGYLHNPAFAGRRGTDDQGVVRGPIVHPGTHGKHVFRKGATAATPTAAAVLAKANINAVREAFS